MRPLLLFLLWPALEIVLFILAGDLFGLWATLGLVLATTALGVLVIRRQKGATLARMRSPQESFKDPTSEIADGAVRFIAGMMLVIPGFATDLIGLALLLPPVRRLMLGRMAVKMAAMGGRAAGAQGFGAQSFGGPGGFAYQEFRTGPVAQGDIIEGEVTEITPDAKALPGSGPRRPSGWQSSDVN